MVAALARREQLLSRIAEIDPRAAPERRAPAVLADVLSENVRFERVLAGLERGAFVDPEEASDDDELAPVVQREGERRAEVPLDGRGKERDRRRALLTLGILAPVAAVVMLSEGMPTPRAEPAAKPPREARTVRLTGVVTSHAGEIDVREGERCVVHLADSGDLDAGRLCLIDVRCPRVSQRFTRASCPIGDDPSRPVRLQTSDLEIDAVARTATFMANWRGSLYAGGATLRLDETR